MSQVTCPDKFSKNWQIAIGCAFERALTKYKEIYETGHCTTMGTWYGTGIYGFSANSKLIKEIKIFLAAGHGRYHPSTRYASSHFSFDYRRFLPENYQKVICNDPDFDKKVDDTFINTLQEMGVPGSDNLSAGVVQTGDL